MNITKTTIMKKKLLLAFVALLLIGFYACNKKDNKQELTTAEKVLGIWHLESDIFHDHFNNTDNYDTTKGQPNDILDFRKDGNVYVSSMGVSDTTIYSIAGDTKIIIGGNIAYDIKTISFI